MAHAPTPPPPGSIEELKRIRPEYVQKYRVARKAA